MHRGRFALLVALLPIGLLGIASLNRTEADGLSATEFAQLRQLILPSDGEDLWCRIPWLTDLWQARKKAAAEGKPILLWEMDGHPLGCT